MQPVKAVTTLGTHSKSMLPALVAIAMSSLASTADAQQRNAAPAREAPIALAPHRAVYDFTLGKARTEKSVTALTGRMVYEFTGSTCEGWSQTMRFVTRTTTAAGTSSVTDQRSTSWENDAATQLRFSSSQYRDHRSP